jgi:hypothetical protein
MKKNNQEEIKDLLHQLSIGEEEAAEMVREIAAGDELLDRYRDPALPGEVKDRILQTIRQSCSLRRPRNRAMRMTALAASVLLVMGIGLALWQDGAANPSGKAVAAKGEWEWLDHEDVIFETVLAEDEYEAGYDLDDISLTEWMWTQVYDNEGEGSVRKEYRYENNVRNSGRSFISRLV